MSQINGTARPVVEMNLLCSREREKAVELEWKGRGGEWQEVGRVALEVQETEGKFYSESKRRTSEPSQHGSVIEC